jgi:hypothetical protein
VDDELRIGLGAGGERVALERDLADHGAALPAGAAPSDGDVCTRPMYKTTDRARERMRGRV